MFKQMENLPITLSADDIEAFCRKWMVTELALFGSVVRDDFSPESDVDVLATFAPGAPWSLWDWADMRADLAAIFGREVDLVEKDALRNPFRRQAIMREHRIIYAAQ